ncbi:MAG: PEP-CTERM sorting domain-containing protein [Verrucomicrobiota bacterium]
MEYELILIQLNQFLRLFLRKLEKMMNKTSTARYTLPVLVLSLFLSVAATGFSALTITETFDNTSGNIQALDEISTPNLSSGGFDYFSSFMMSNGNRGFANSREQAVRLTTTGELEFVYGGDMNNSGSRTSVWPGIMWFGLTNTSTFFSSSDDLTFSVDATLSTNLQYRLLIDVDFDADTTDGLGTQIYVSDTAYTNNLSSTVFDLTDSSQWFEMTDFSQLEIDDTANPVSMQSGNVHRVGLYIEGTATTGSTAAFDNFSFTAVPEPSSVALLLCGLATLFARSRRR